MRSGCLPRAGARSVRQGLGAAACAAALLVSGASPAQPTTAGPPSPQAQPSQDQPSQGLPSPGIQPSPQVLVPSFSRSRGVLLPGVGAVDPRVTVDVDQPPWRGVVRVQTELGGRCTGFLVGPSVAITAAHCLASRQPGQFVRPGSVHVLSGYRDGRYAGQAIAVALRPAPGYDPQREDATAGADWAVLALSAPLGTADRVLRLAGTAATGGAAVVLGGYGQDRSERIEADLRCHVLGAASDAEGRPLLRHGCAATRGTSGAPLLSRGDGGWRVVGVQIAGDARGAGGLAVPLQAGAGG